MFVCAVLPESFQRTLSCIVGFENYLAQIIMTKKCVPCKSLVAGVNALLRYLRKRELVHRVTSVCLLKTFLDISKIWNWSCMFTTRV